MQNALLSRLKRESSFREPPIEQVLRPFQEFFRVEASSGIMLLAATVIALIWANSPWGQAYIALWETKFSVLLGDFGVSKDLLHWINDGLMAVFFFMVGLEIKREVLAGELSTLKKASLPIVAAVGGMMVPALVYVLINYNNPEYLSGWGIPMATDIAFALGIMSLMGSRVPTAAKIFLTALAIADDLGAILIIAIFYTESINLAQLVNAGIFLIILVVANRIGIRRTSFYAIVGFLGVWLSFLYSGIHATIAGVLIALTIPVRTKVSEKTYIDEVCELVDKFKNASPNESSLLTSKQAHLITDIEKISDAAHTPLQKLEHALHPVTAYLILPIFALANAGVKFEGGFLSLLFHPVSVGIFLGLVLGKAVGISLFSRLMVALKISVLPEGMSWRQIYGVSLFAGIGFTMSIFIAGLAFANETIIQVSKIGVFAGSLISALLGVWLLSTGKKKT